MRYLILLVRLHLGYRPLKTGRNEKGGVAEAALATGLVKYSSLEGSSAYELSE